MCDTVIGGLALHNLGGLLRGDDVLRVAVESLADEMFAVEIYRRLAGLYRSEATRAKLLRIAEMEEGHVEYWRSFLERRGYDPSTVRINRLKVALYTALFRLLGLGLTLRILEIDEREAAEVYSKLIDHPELSEEEKRGLTKLLEDELVHEEEVSREESRFEEFLRHVKDAVLGMNDGLVEVLSVTTGLVGVYGDPFHVALGGLIVGTAGALSMGIGAYASVKAQRQVHEGLLRHVGAAARYAARVFRDRVVGYMTRKGFSRRVSEALAEESVKNEKLLSRIVAEEEYGLREESLEDPGKAGLYTGFFYMVGAALPLIPYFAGLTISVALVLSLVFAGLALAVTGSIIALSANLPVKRKVVEMMLFGLGSAAATFIIGRLASILFGIEAV